MPVGEGTDWELPNSGSLWVTSTCSLVWGDQVLNSPTESPFTFLIPLLRWQTVKLECKKRQHVIWPWMQRINTLLTDYSWKSWTKRSILRQSHIYTYIYIDIYMCINNCKAGSLFSRSQPLHLSPSGGVLSFSWLKEPLGHWFWSIWWWLMGHRVRDCESFSAHRKRHHTAIGWCAKSDNWPVFFRKTWYL